MARFTDIPNEVIIYILSYFTIREIADVYKAKHGYLYKVISHPWTIPMNRIIMDDKYIGMAMAEKHFIYEVSDCNLCHFKPKNIKKVLLTVNTFSESYKLSNADILKDKDLTIDFTGDQSVSYGLTTITTKDIPKGLKYKIKNHVNKMDGVFEPSSIIGTKPALVLTNIHNIEINNLEVSLLKLVNCSNIKCTIDLPTCVIDDSNNITIINDIGICKIDNSHNIVMGDILKINVITNSENISIVDNVRDRNSTGFCTIAFSKNIKMNTVFNPDVIKSENLKANKVYVPKWRT